MIFTEISIQAILTMGKVDFFFLIFKCTSEMGLNRLFMKGFPGESDAKESACSAGDLGSTPGLGRSPGEEHEYLLWSSCLESPADRAKARHGKQARYQLLQ